MKIDGLLNTGRPSLSFEFFPPRDGAGEQRLLETVRRLRKFKPAFVSVTYGAGGSSRDRTLDWVARLKEHGLSVMPHLTGVGASERDVAAICERLQKLGVQNLLLLRGDPPKNVDRLPARGEFRSAVELLHFVRSRFDFCLAAACYPERHPEAKSREADLEHLAAKVDAGAAFLITQFFFRSEDFLSFRAEAQAIGIRAPIVPGILPPVDLSAISRMAARCGASIPETLKNQLESVTHPELRAGLGIETARSLCDGLLTANAPGLHFYTRNQSQDTASVLEALYHRFQAEESAHEEPWHPSPN